MKTIAVTGGMGAGKTETIRIMVELGASAIHADSLAHDAYSKGSVGYDELVDAFGGEVLNAYGEIDRTRLGSSVFEDQAKREELESIVWPLAKLLAKSKLVENREQSVEITALEVPKLFEAGWDDLADIVWTVEAPYHQRLTRAVARTGLSEEAVRSRFDSQLSPETRIKSSNNVIYNDGDLDALERQVTELWEATKPK